MADEKLKKAVVLYYPAKQVGTKEGTSCGACMMFFGGGKCTVVEGKIDGDNGVCGLYVFGEHMGPTMEGMTPKSVVGYITNAPTHCGNCENYNGGEDNSGSCKIVEGNVEALGCCNAWEAGKSDSEDSNPYLTTNKR